MAQGRPNAVVSIYFYRFINWLSQLINSNIALLTKVIIEFRHTQCFTRWREEPPETVVRSAAARLHLLGRNGLRQRIFRSTQLEFCASSVDCRYTTDSVHVASTTGGDGSRGEVRGLHRRPCHREMEGGSQVGRRQLQ